MNQESYNVTVTLSIIIGHLVGDFIEFYGEDAEAIAEACDLTVMHSKKWEGGKMAGYPAHAIARLQRNALTKAGIIIQLDLSSFVSPVEKPSYL